VHFHTISIATDISSSQLRVKWLTTNVSAKFFISYLLLHK